MRTMKTACLIPILLCLMLAPSHAEKEMTKPTSFTRGLLDCTGIQPLPCNSTVQGDNRGLPNNVNYYSCVGWLESGGEQVWEVVITEPMQVAIILTPSPGCDLDFFILIECDEAACEFFADDAIVGFAPVGTYVLVVDGYLGAECEYELSLTCQGLGPPEEEPGSICNFVTECINWDFAEGNHGFTPADCGGAAVWEYGAEVTIPGAPGNVWGTVLNGNYVNNAGHSLVSPPFTVEAGCNWMEIKHYVYTEGLISGIGNIYDGGNVTVDGIVIPPVEGYDGTAVTLPPCVAVETVFAGDSVAEVPMRTWGTSCFDLSEFMDMTIQVSFDFGSDGAVTLPGWYLAYVKIGSTGEPIGVESQTWGAVKSLYR